MKKRLLSTGELLGLRSSNGRMVQISQWSTILRNSFYIGTTQVSTTKERYTGIHPALGSTPVFNQVQEIKTER